MCKFLRSFCGPRWRYNHCHCGSRSGSTFARRGGAVWLIRTVFLCENEVDLLNVGQVLRAHHLQLIHLSWRTLYRVIQLSLTPEIIYAACSISLSKSIKNIQIYGVKYSWTTLHTLARTEDKNPTLPHSRGRSRRQSVWPRCRKISVVVVVDDVSSMTHSPLVVAPPPPFISFGLPRGVGVPRWRVGVSE